MSNTTTPMAKLDPSKTIRFPRFGSGRMEIWTAFSADGRWSYERIEDSGTPWIAKNAETGVEHWTGTLPAARRWTFKFDTCEHNVVDRPREEMQGTNLDGRWVVKRRTWTERQCTSCTAIFPADAADAATAR
jgi:hypothetical protein